MNSRVQITVESHVAYVMLNRAEKLNAIDMPMFEELGAAADRLAGERSVRAVVLYGSGENFCTGIDLTIFANAELDFTEALQFPVEPSPANVFQRAAYAWRELPIPVICAIQGVCFGGGLQIALGADVRYASPDAKLSIMEAKWGIIPDMGISATLRQLVAPDHVKELAWSARILGGEEARRLGLVTALVDDPLAASRELALQCADRSPEAVRGIKLLVNQAWQGPERDALALEAALQAGIIGSANQVEAVQANLASRRPDFKD
ncbi:MAG TPA: crotonase/enoyl-CoA hydratase family protein [Woeseiaceae bacterium]|nr:crotonase/enoyl-CoA hydratase family protein [Woeseiaceae bacterium]